MSSALKTVCNKHKDPSHKPISEIISAATVSACIEAFESRLRGIVLTGSMARNEATLAFESGHRKILGDAEFFLVFNDNCRLPDAAEVEPVRRRAMLLLGKESVSCDIDLRPVDSRYLRNLQPHILTYELKQCGRVVWGAPQLLSLVREFPPSDILLEDGWRILSNRIVEFLPVAATLAQDGATMAAEALYRTVKLYLDTASSLLVFTGEYEPTYSGRQAKLRALAAQPGSTGLPFALERFAERIDSCTDFKLQKSSPVLEAALTGEKAVRFRQDAIEYAYRLWRWELCQLAGVKETLTDRELMQAWMRRQPLRARFRGWIPVVRGVNLSSRRREWFHWLRSAAVASPRHLVYAVAIEVFSRLPLLVEAPETEPIAGLDTGYLCKKLPLSRRASLDRCPSWQQTAAAIYSDYLRFVSVTTA